MKEMMLYFLACLVGASQATTYCQEDCSSVKCKTIDPEECKAKGGVFEKGHETCCCDLCIVETAELIAEHGDDCSASYQHLGLNIRCKGELQCDFKTQKCSTLCEIQRNSLESLRRRKKKLLGLPRVSCEDNGQYSATQCRGSMCFCHDLLGRKIEGYSASISEFENMNCQCARAKDTYRKTGLIGKTFQCKPNGNYSPIQCIGSVCHCSDLSGEKIQGYSAPISESKEMNCQCARAKDAYMKTGMIGKTFQCESNGNYSPIQCTGTVCHCSDPFGKKRNDVKEFPIHMAAQNNC